MYDQVIFHRVPSFILVFNQAFSNYVYDHVFLLQSSMFPAYWILMTSGESSASVMRVLVIQLRPALCVDILAETKLYNSCVPSCSSPASKIKSVSLSTACQCVKAGNKFDKGGEKLKSVPVLYQTMNQLGIDLVTNLPVTPEGYNTIVTAVDYTSKWVESRALKGKFAKDGEI